MRPLSRPLAGLALLALFVACGPTAQTGDGFGLPDGFVQPDSGLPKDATPTGLTDATTAEADALDDTLADADAVEEVYDGPACTTDAACKGLAATPWCAKVLQQCVECLFPMHCPGTGNCTNFKCQTFSCKPGSQTCVGAFLEVCNADGKSATQQACPDDKPVCVGDACRVCEPGKLFCAKAQPGQAQAQVAMQCNGDGSAATVAQTCGAGEQCFAGKCQACVPGTKTCEGDQAMECASDGSGWQPYQDCGANGWTCLGGLCVNACDADIKSNTNVGCDYWAIDLDNAVDSNGGKIYDAQNAQFSVIVSNTSTKPATVDVTLGIDKTKPGAKTKSWTVLPKALQVIHLPDPTWGIPNQNQDGSNVNDRVFRIQSTQPIVAYQFNPLQNYGVFSNDASLLLPTQSLGKTYWVLSRSQLGPKFRSYFNVIAVMPGKTKVMVVVAAKTLAGPGVPAMNVGQTQTFELAQGQSLNIESDQEGADLSGSYVQADKAVAVFGGSEASNSPTFGNCVAKGTGFGKVCASTGLDGSGGKPCTKDQDCESACCADHLEEQLFPIDALGQTYVATRLFPRGKEQDAWRILAAENDTVVTLVPPVAVVPKLQQGEYFELQTTQDFLIQSNKPVLVGQYMASSYATVTKELATCSNESQCKSQYGFVANCESGGFSKYCAPIGDPSLILGVATTQYLDDYLFLVPDKYKLNYINIVAEQGTQVSIDGLAYAAGVFTAIGTTGWTVARLPIMAGAHRLETSKPVGLVVYGYDDDVSYGYPGGAGLTKN